ncbi:hypothetical protein [Endozoicomonas sp. ONNA2]|uniref:hypothetical protein n=1 Tax=Endozoicomonas sp. ONNA2 TaxID=2828741 RepID=UPI002147DDD9|nr:hypothetical protein [Endozoicomonas sp. ONNA2]
MPQIPKDHTSSHSAGYTPSSLGKGHRATNSREKQSVETITRVSEHIESKYWHNRLISFCREKINRFIHPAPSVKVSDLVDDLTKHNPQNPQKVLAALKLHAGKSVKLHQSEDGRLGISDGQVAIGTETIEAVVKSSQLSSMDMTYEYLRRGKILPEGFLQQIILPHIHRKIRLAIQYEKTSGLPVIQQQLQGRQQYGTHREQQYQYIKDLLKRVGIKDEKTFTFERMLEVKRELRNNLVLPIEEQKSVIGNKVKSIGHGALNPQQPPPPQLPEPGKTDHFIEKEDCKHIQKLASGERFFSNIHLKDIGNRIKRNILRNKRNQIINFCILLAGVILTAIFPPAGMAIGIAVAVGLVTDIGYVVFWSASTELWRRFRMARGLKQIKKYADFDYTNVDKSNDKKRRELIKKLRYRCTHKTFTEIYSAYAELEKQALKLEKMAEKEQRTLEESIALEKEKALYYERRKKLKANLFFFEKLIENVIISRNILENRHIKDLEELWNTKFKDMPTEKREEVFKSVCSNKQLMVHGHQIKISDEKWISRIIPRWMNHTQSVEDQTVSDSTVIEPINTSVVFKSAGIFKEIIQEFFYSQIKGSLYKNLLNFFKIAGKRGGSINITPVAPKISLHGALCFVAFFFVEMASNHANTKINEKRMAKIIKKQSDYTRQLFGKRLRTGREEVGTMRTMAKQQLEPMVDHLLDSIKSMEEIGDKLEEARQRSELLNKGTFEAMSDEEAAILILKHAALQQLLDQEINGAFGEFHRVVQEKSATLNKKIARTLIANSARVISAVSEGQERGYIPKVAAGREAADQHSQNELQRLSSEDFLQSIQDQPCGRLIRRLRAGEISEGLAFKEIRELDSLDQLRNLSIWIEKAQKEGSYQEHEDTLKMFHSIVTYIIEYKYKSSQYPQYPIGNLPPVDPI